MMEKYNILLIAYDNGSHINLFPLSIGYIARTFLQEKWRQWNVDIYQQDIYHWNEKHLTKLLKTKRYDYIGISAVGGYYQYEKCRKIVKAIKEAKGCNHIIGGGYLFSADPQHFIEKWGMNGIVRGEGIKLAGHLSDYDPFEIDPVREFPLIKNADDIEIPAYALFPIEHYCLKQPIPMANHCRAMPILSGWGCPFQCNFCYHWETGYRGHSPKYIVNHIKYLQKTHQINYISFQDDLFMISKKRTMELCEALRPLRIKWDCQGRLNHATKEVLQEMKQAGCWFINWGIESVDDEALERMNKKLTVKEIYNGVDNCKEIGIKQGLNIIWPGLGETTKQLKKDVHFLLKYSDSTQLRTIRPVTPYPGSPLYYYCIKKGLIKDIEDFYCRHENSDLMTVNWTRMSDDRVYKNLKWANDKLIANYYKQKEKTSCKITDKLYNRLDSSFRGFRDV